MTEHYNSGLHKGRKFVKISALSVENHGGCSKKSVSAGYFLGILDLTIVLLYKEDKFTK